MTGEGKIGPLTARYQVRTTSIAKAMLEADENALDQHSKDRPFGA